MTAVAIKTNKTDFKVPESLYIQTVTPKRKICLMDTLMRGMDHIERLMIREDDNTRKTPTYTIDENGEIFEHFDPKYYSEMFNDEIQDKTTINIAFVNLGWLSYDIVTDSFINWYSVTIPKDRVFEKPFGEYNYWCNYTTKQINSAIKLCHYLCDEFHIKKEFSNTFFKMDNTEKFQGILTRRNITSDYFDVNPAFQIKKFAKEFPKT